jgi:hypothetical protein
LPRHPGERRTVRAWTLLLFFFFFFLLVLLDRETAALRSARA